MELKPISYEKICQLLHKGVDIPNPLTIDIGNDVNVDQISEKGVRIYPGCRIYGRNTVISAGSQIGYEAPATIENCQIGEKVELKGGYFSQSVFLGQAKMGMGAHVREGSILEEQASGAHCVGLKQTLLFPFVTLGSLINFCDCLMAGGTSRRNHSEVGSSYIHFNFTPAGDKTTPSLIGDVPRGVMLNQPPIFLGGQGGIVGPLRLGYGNVVAAGAILRNDHPEDNKLIFEMTSFRGECDYAPAAYPNFRRIVENNLRYLGNLIALEAWYTHVRKSFLEAQEFGRLLYAGVMDQLLLARKERLKRLRAMLEKAGASASQGRKQVSARNRQAFYEQLEILERLFSGPLQDEIQEKYRDAFLLDFQKAAGKSRANYIETIQNLPPDVASSGTRWLSDMVDRLCENASKTMPLLKLFKQ